MASATAPTAAPTPAPASVATAAPPSASTSAAPAPKVAAAEAAPLAATVAAYLHLQARLAADDDAGAAAGWQRLKQQLGAAPFDHPALKPHATALKDALRGRPATLADHRRGFQRVGKALIPTLKASPAAGGAPLTVFFCPMAFENTGAEWLQPAGSRLANPYFGAGMLRCGSARGQIQP